MEFWKLIDIIEKALTIGVLVGGVLAFVFKTWIAEWIKRRLTAAMTKELEDHRHKLARELEGYKGALLKELEQYRANIDIKRSIALKMADARLDALRKLAVALNRFSNEAESMCRMNTAQKKLNQAEYNDSVVKTREAKREAEIFLTYEYNVTLSQAVSEAIDLTVECMEKELTLEMKDPRLLSVRVSLATVAVDLRNLIVEDFPVKAAAIAH